MEKGKGKDKKDKRLMIAIIIIIILLLLLLRSCISQEDTLISSIGWDTNAEEGDIEEISEEEIQEELNQKVEEGLIRISMNSTPVFSSGSAKGNLMIVNDKSNNYPQVVYIVRKDTQEEIYRSGAIPVGSRIEYAKLDVKLAAGTYDCVAYFNNVNVDTGEFLGTAGAEITITVSK